MEEPYIFQTVPFIPVVTVQD